MHRRDVLVAGGLTLSLVAGGCIGKAVDPYVAREPNHEDSDDLSPESNARHESSQSDAVPGVGTDYDCHERVNPNSDAVGTHPKPVYEHTQYVQKVRREFEREYDTREQDWVQATGIGNADTMVCSSFQDAIVIWVSSDDEAEAAQVLPETYRDVPVVIKTGNILDEEPVWTGSE